MSDDGAPEVPWRDLFGFEEPYDNQADAVEAAIDVGRRRGYLAMEGSCGTGKTMAALTAGAALVRHTDLYDTVLVVTPVKQQLLQFVEDLRTLNAGLEEPLDGVSLVGKTDLCPYGREGVFPADAGVHDRCEDLREATAGLVEADDGVPADSRIRPAASAALSPPGGGDQWWDPERASDLATAARRDGGFRTLVDEPLATAGAESPYVRQQPQAPEEFGGEDPPLYCPFEADWYARNRGSPLDFDVGREHVVTAAEFLPAAVERGTCPHRVMGVMLEHADVVVGNYNHLFDPKTRPLLSSVLDERTFVVVDEAHRLEGRVRDLLSARLGRQTLAQARNDCAQVLGHAGQSSEHREQVEERLASHDVPLEAVERARTFLDDLVGWLDDRVETHLEAEYGRGWRVGDLDALPAETVEIPLRDPEVAEPDALTEWAQERGYDGGLWRSLGTVGAAVERAVDELGPDRTCVVAATGTVLERWWTAGHVSHLREIELRHSPSDRAPPDRPWEGVYAPGLVLFDCMPADQLATAFEGLGGGLLMSATLEPLSVFTEVAGLDALAAGEDDRPVETRTYDLPFPERNRASWVVDATPFTARNRGPPATGERTEHQRRVREEYEHVLRTVARSPGRALVCMPNYREAAWAGAYLEDAVDVPVFVDASSSNEETERRKQAFFDAAEAVLVTSTRGTLTEGVDYDGDKLHTCAVVGVPLVNIGSPRVRAVRRAYAEAFGEDNAFEYALTVPAVRRARQAIGRVIRGADEVGVRLFVGRRYTADAVNSVARYLPEAERREFTRMTPMFLESQFESFWAEHGEP